VIYNFFAKKVERIAHHDEKTPCFVSPVYSVPISIRLEMILTEVVELMPLVNRLAGN
jgi:hypothetical protein